MKIIKGCNTLIVALAFVPAVLFGFDLPGYATFHGKIIDADTLKPIEGAVVWALWMKCRPGIGSGSCEYRYGERSPNRCRWRVANYRSERE